jgi:signal transduction histidine kinase
VQTPPTQPDDRIAALLRACAVAAPDDAALLRAAADELADLRSYKARTELQMIPLFETITAFAAAAYDHQVPVHENNDEITNAMAIGLNMMGEELAHSTQALIAARDEALAANRAKSAFLANISHELRTPLNAIIGYAEMIREELVANGQSGLTLDLDRLMIASRHLLNLIQDVLDLARIEAGRLDVRPEVVDLRTLLADLTATLGPSVQSAGNKLSIDLSLTQPLLHTDPLRLQQILLNLLGNANKFTLGGSITLAAHNEAFGGLPGVAIAVIDTGIGIPPDKLEAVFDAFTQVDNTATRRFGGTGLGLTICRRLCELLGGTMDVVSRLDLGSTFTVRLPTAHAEGDLAQETATTLQPASAMP